MMLLARAVLWALRLSVVLLCGCADGFYPGIAGLGHLDSSISTESMTMAGCGTSSEN